MIGKRVQEVLALAVTMVRRRRHEYLTLEHLLYGIACEESGQRLIKACGGDIDAVKETLDQFFDTLESIPEPQREIVQTMGVQRALESALHHVRAAGKRDEDMAVGDLLAAVLEEEDSWAAFSLHKQGVSRLLVLEQLSHGGFEDEDEEDSGGDFFRSRRPGHRRSDARRARDPRPCRNGEEQGEKDALAKYTVDLTARAQAGEIDPLVGRETEIARSIEILARRRKNNPLYVGEPGTGKTAVAEGLALRIANGQVPEIFKESRIFSLDLGAVLAGSRYRGDFEGRVRAVVAALGEIPGSILFIDEIHTIVGAGSSSGGAMDASNLLKPVLAQGKLRCIGSTTHEEFRNHFEKDRALARRFQRVDIREPSPEDCLEILKGLRSRYEEHHQVRYTHAALRAAVDLSVRHVQDRLLPDKAIDVMDEAGASVRLRPGARPGVSVGLADVEKVVARMAGIPVSKLSGQDRDRLKNLKKDLQASIYGQDEAVDLVTRSVLRVRAGLGRTDRPAGSFLFYGPTGVGKTELARRLAEVLGVSLLRFDMSEYMEKHAVSRLIGSPPGYVGFEQGGLLTEAVRKTPYAVLLLDEVEKAHPDIMNVLLQVMDAASLTDNTGRKADFHNVVLIMTSNAGARDMASSPLGFLDRRGDVAEGARRARKAVENAFSPEFRNRLDALVPFNGLTPDLMGLIVDKGIRDLRRQLEDRRVRLSLSASARDWLASKGYDPKLGARPLQRLLRESLEDPLSEEILFGRLARGGEVQVDAPQDGNGRLTFSFA